MRFFILLLVFQTHLANGQNLISIDSLSKIVNDSVLNRHIQIEGENLFNYYSKNRTITSVKTFMDGFQNQIEYQYIIKNKDYNCFYFKATNIHNQRIRYERYLIYYKNQLVYFLINCNYNTTENQWYNSTIKTFSWEYYPKKVKYSTYPLPFRNTEDSITLSVMDIFNNNFSFFEIKAFKNEFFWNQFFKVKNTNHLEVMLKSIDPKIVYLTALRLNDLMKTSNYEPRFAIKKQIKQILKRDFNIITREIGHHVSNMSLKKLYNYKKQTLQLKS